MTDNPSELLPSINAGLADERDYSPEEIEFIQCLLDRYSEGNGFNALALDHPAFMRIVRKHYILRTPTVTEEAEHLRGAIDAAMTDLDLLRRAIEESDPQRELLIRTTDTWRRLNDAVSTSPVAVTEGKGEAS